MTAPHIGNTGVNDEDPESSRIWVAGYVVRDPARIPSNWRSRRPLEDQLDDDGVVGISGIDTRALTRHLRDAGAMRVGVSSAPRPTRARCTPGCWPARACSAPTWPRRSPRPEAYVVPAIGAKKFTVVAVDLGIKAMTPHRMAQRGIEVHVVPATVSAADVLARDPDGVFLSNGPGDPGVADYAVDIARGVLDGAGAAVRHLLRQPDPRPGARLRDLQAALRPPRDQPAGDGPHHRQGRDHRAQPRLRRGRPAGPDLRHALTAAPRSATSASTTTSSKACAAWTSRPSPSSTTRRRRPVRTTPGICSTGSPS